MNECILTFAGYQVRTLEKMGALQLIQKHVDDNIEMKMKMNTMHQSVPAIRRKFIPEVSKPSRIGILLIF